VEVILRERAGQAGDASVVNARLVVEQDENVVEGCPELVRQNIKFDVNRCHWKNILFHYHEPFSRKP
jgi:hypothetical protein